MRHLALAAALVWFSLAPGHAAEFDSEAYCRTFAESVVRAKTIVAACRRSEERAKREVEGTNPEPRILAYCIGIAQALGGSYGILKGCIDEERSAKARLADLGEDRRLVARCRALASSAGGSYLVEKSCIERALADHGRPPISPRESPARHGARPDETGSPRASVEAYCVELWPGEERMRGRCVTEQLDAQTTLADLLETHLDGSSERRAVWRCLDRWPAAQGGYDYRMAVACAEEEIKADRAARP